MDKTKENNNKRQPDRLSGKTWRETIKVCTACDDRLQTLACMAFIKKIKRGDKVKCVLTNSADNGYTDMTLNKTYTVAAVRLNALSICVEPDSHRGWCPKRFIKVEEK